MSRTYGTLAWDKGVWRVAAEAHVMLRLKRVFERLAKVSFRAAEMTDSPDTCRDLEWFVSRYPLALSPDDARRLAEGSASYAERVRVVENILGEHYSAPSLPLAIPLRDYQARATQLYLARKSLLIADDVGTGKSSIGIGSFCDPRVLPAVVVTLTSLPRQWQREIAKFAPTLHTWIAPSSKAQPLPEWFGHPPDVVILNYAKLGLGDWAGALAKYAHSVIFDECQELRRDGTGKWMAAKHVADACAFRAGLSATPIYNYGGELFNVLEVIAPGFLGTRAEFQREWCAGYGLGGDQDRIRDPKAIGSYLRDQGVMIRRTRHDVGRELPGISRVVHAVEADPAVLARAEGSAVELAQIILRRAGATREERFSASGRFDMLMRQATGVAKAPYVAEFVRLLLESEERILVYAWHREVYTVLLDALREFAPVMFTGSESTSAKLASFDAFTKGGSRVMLMSLRAGAGLDGLQGNCRTVVFAELDWSPGVHEQATGRVARDGQPDPVMSYYLVAENEDSADPYIMQALGLKADQIEGIRDPEKPIVEVLETSEKQIHQLAAAYLARQEKRGRHGRAQTAAAKDDQGEGRGGAPEGARGARPAEGATLQVSGSRRGEPDLPF